MSRRTFTLILVFTILLPSFLTASDAHGEDHHFDWTAFWGWFLNSTLLFGGLVVLLRKPLVRLLSERSLGIKEDIVGRERDIRDSRQRYEKLEDRLQTLEVEIEALQTAARQEGLTGKAELEEAGRREAERIMALTEEEISARVETALKRLKANVADSMIDRFKEEIGKQLDEAAHRRIIGKNIDISGDVLERE